MQSTISVVVLFSFLSLQYLVAFHCMNIAHLTYSFYCRQISESFIVRCYYEYCCYESSCTCFWWTYALTSLYINVQNSCIIWCLFFHFLRYCQTIFQSGYVNLYFHWQSMKISVAPYSCQYLILMFLFGTSANSMCVCVQCLWFQFAFCVAILTRLHGVKLLVEMGMPSKGPSSQ